MQEDDRKLLQARRPVRRDEQARVLGPNPGPWVEILETTGVARTEGAETVPRGALFRQWTEENQGALEQTADDGFDLSSVGAPGTAHELERTVVRATSRWARSVTEYPTIFLRSESKGGGNLRDPPVSGR